MKSVERTIENAGVEVRLDRVRMSPGERRAAQASLRQGEFIAEMLMRANDDLRLAFRFIGRGLVLALRRGKLSSANPALRLP